MKQTEKRITGAQVKAARALLNWSQEDLANKASLTMTPVSRMERDNTPFSLSFSLLKG